MKNARLALMWAYIGGVVFCAGFGVVAVMFPPGPYQFDDLRVMFQGVARVMLPVLLFIGAMWCTVLAIITGLKAKADPPEQVKTLRGFISSHLDEVARECSQGGKCRYTRRQLYYAFRPLIIAEFGEASYDEFCLILSLDSYGLQDMVIG